MGQIVGIDLGTTNSLVAHFGPDGPVIIETPAGLNHVPSAVAVDPTRGLVLGKAARDYSKVDSDAAILSVKRFMGTENTFFLGGQELRPQDVSSMILKELRRAAESHLLSPVDRAVISVPAYFSEVQRRATREAGEIAGLKVERLISEPTAAALAYGIDKPDSDEYVLVYDLGGGTFDVSVLEMFEGIFSVRACHGDSHLGGDDFDEAIFQWVVQRANSRLDAKKLAPEALPKCRLAVEAAKMYLSNDDSTTLRLEGVPCDDGSTVNLGIEVTRENFEKLTRELLEKTGACMTRALAEAKVAKEKIGEILLVGGSTRMPMVQAYLRDYFGKEPNTSVSPMAAVALGTAIQANLLETEPNMDEIVVTDVSPFTLGVAVVSDYAGSTRSGIFSPLIHRNASLPTKVTRSFSTTHPEQDTVEVEIYQGDDPLVENNIFLDRYYLGGIPTGSEKPESLSITFEYDTDGILQVSAVVDSTGKSAGLRIDSSKMKAVGGGLLSARSKVDGFWEKSLSSRTLADLVEKVESSLENRPEDERAQLAARVSAARDAIDQGDNEKIELLIVEFRPLAGREKTDG